MDSIYPRPSLQLKLNQHLSVSSSTVHRRLSSGLLNETEMSPLFQGMGTHYSFIYVGTPPQRVSVIVDTGSHHTAFPCVGCKCGKHMDPYFDPKKSNTSKILNCNGAGNKCFFRQAYSEGSSWHAFKVRDAVYLGGESVMSIPDASKWAVEFEFGCQDSETGLFRTQNVDGIMGLSAKPDTLPYQLVAQKVTASRVFSMCFRIGGGVLTIGGVDPSIHSMGPNGHVPLQFAKLLKSSGWFTVKLLDVRLKDPKTGNIQSIGEPASKYATGKGTIVDSGTTDTYLPTAVRATFEKLFRQMSGGMSYSNGRQTLTKAQYDSLPTVIYRIGGKDNEYIDIESPPSSYAETLRAGANDYAFRIYLTEGSGVVLGANFMNGYNVVFDQDAMQIGFAASDCRYQGGNAAAGWKWDNGQTQRVTGSPAVAVAKEGAILTGYSACSLQLLRPCSAVCPSSPSSDINTSSSSSSPNRIAKKIMGSQTWKACKTAKKKPVWWEVTEACTVLCAADGSAVRGGMVPNPDCFDSPWSPCATDCTQSRTVVSNSPTGSCSPGRVETRQCRVFNCPVTENELAVSIDANLLSTNPISSAHTEELVSGLAGALQMPPQSFHIFGSPTPLLTNDGTNIGFNCQIKLRLTLANTRAFSTMHAAAEAIVNAASAADFRDVVASFANGNSSTSGLWRWLRPADLIVNKATFVNIGRSSPPSHFEEDMAASQEVALSREASSEMGIPSILGVVNYTGSPSGIYGIIAAHGQETQAYLKSVAFQSLDNRVFVGSILVGSLLLAFSIVCMMLLRRKESSKSALSVLRLRRDPAVVVTAATASRSETAAAAAGSSYGSGGGGGGRKIRLFRQQRYI